MSQLEYRLRRALRSMAFVPLRNLYNAWRYARDGWGLFRVSRHVRASIETKKTTFLFATCRSDRDWSLPTESPGIYKWELVYSLLALGLQARGYRCGFIYRGRRARLIFSQIRHRGKSLTDTFVMRDRVLDHESLNKFSSVERWEMDLKQRQAVLQSMNFFHMFEFALRTKFRRYDLDYEDPAVLAAIEVLQKSAESALAQFRLMEEYARETGEAVRIVGREAGYLPCVAWNALCRLSDADIQFIDCNHGYIQYFGSFPGETYVLAVNTTSISARDPSGALFHRLSLSAERWKEIERDEQLAKLGSRALQDVLAKGYRHSKSSPEKLAMLETLQEQQKQGRRVFVLFAHVFFDTELIDRSAAFDGMTDWVRQTIAYFRGRGDILVLKPHPWEEDPDRPNDAPDQCLASIAFENGPLPGNIVLLPPRLLSLGDIQPVTDIALIWRSNVALELACLKTPSIIAGEPYYRVLPLNFVRSAKEYFEAIENAASLAVTKAQQDAAATYMGNFRKRHLSISALHNPRFNRPALVYEKAVAALDGEDADFDEILGELVS